MPPAAESISKTEAAYRTLRQEILQARLAPGLQLKLGAAGFIQLQAEDLLHLCQVRAPVERHFLHAELLITGG